MDITDKIDERFLGRNVSAAVPTSKHMPFVVMEKIEPLGK